MIVENTDCIDFFKQVEDGCVDLIVCDPPYKITARGNTTHGGWLSTKKGLQGTIFKYNDLKCERVFSTSKTPRLVFCISSKESPLPLPINKNLDLGVYGDALPIDLGCIIARRKQSCHI